MAQHARYPERRFLHNLVSYGSYAAILAWTFWSVQKVAVHTNWLQQLLV